MDKPTSLMQRRKVQLGQLKNTIQTLSITKKQRRNSFFKINILKEQDNQQNQKDSNQGENDTSIDPSLRLSSTSSIPSTAEERDFENAFEQKFRAQQVLGQGAHGIVKRCIHKATGKEFAVKILKMEDQHFQSLKTNFINIKQLKHDALIKYKALYLNPNQRKCHLVMEYLPYPSLKRGLSEDDLRQVFYKILEALEYIHKKHISHRDIKPDNILFHKKTGVVKIIDFGVSKNMKLRGRYQEMLTNTGTYYYKAPEMFLGGGYTEKVDNWAVGISLYEMITGVTPFASEYFSETIDNILRKELDFEREQFSVYDPLLRDLLCRLLKRNPKERMSCEQAKKHLWFHPHLKDIDLMKSAGYNRLQQSNNELKGGAFGSMVFRQRSTGEERRQGDEEFSKTDKKVMKEWLEIINEDDNSSIHALNNQIKFDFVESESDEETFAFKLPTNVKAVSMYDGVSKIKQMNNNHKNKSVEAFLE